MGRDRAEPCRPSTDRDWARGMQAPPGCQRPREDVGLLLSVPGPLVGRKCPGEQAKEGNVTGKHLLPPAWLMKPCPSWVSGSVTRTEHLLYQACGP